VSRYRWTILGVGTGAQACFAMASAGLPAMAPALRSGYGLTIGQVGVVLASVLFGMLATLLLWGVAADRIGERTVIAVGLGGAGAALVATAWTSTLAWLAIGLFVAGLSGASVNAASGRAVMGWFGPDARGLALGIRATAIPLGGALAAAVLPWLADAGGTKLAFLALGGACIVGSVAAAAFIRDPVDRQAEHREAEAGRPPLRDREMWLLSTASSLYVVAQLALTAFVVLFLHDHRGVSAGAAAGLLAVTNLFGAAARIAAGRWSDRIRTRLAPLRLLGLALACVTALTAALVDAPLGALVPTLFAAGVLSQSWNGLSFTAAAETAGAARAGAALGFQQTMLAVAGAAVPIAFAATVEATSWRVAFALAAIAPVAGYLTLRGVTEPSRGARTAALAARAAAETTQ
jgi:sugar phosphate permease